MTTQGEKPSSAKATEDTPAETRREWIARRLFETWPPDPPLVSWDEAASKDFWRERADEYLDMERRVIASPQEGEKPAEARAALAEALRKRADWLRDERLHGGDFQHLLAREGECRWLSEQAGRGTGPFAALSSPQEGATAVGADELVAWLRKEGADWQPGEEEWQSPFGNRLIEAAARIEALQRQVDIQKGALADALECYGNCNKEREAAESSLRTLGDALERAREALAEHDLTNDGCKRCGEESYQKCGAWTIDHAPECVFAVLTPPTRDTSCEAVAKQEPATKWDVRKSPCPTCGHHIRTVERVPFQYDDEPAASDKGADK